MNKPARKVTAQDVADLLGLSRSAVSRAFTPGASIQPDKRQRILAAAEALGYQPNFFARTLGSPDGSKRSNLVAILVGDVSSPWQAWLFETLASLLQQQGKQPVLLNVRQEEDPGQAILRLSGYQVDGLIAIVGSLPADSVEQCQRLSLPLVTLGRSDVKGQIPSVQTDNRLAGELAASHLLAQGLTRLAFVAGRQDGQASQERWQGFSQRVVAQTGSLPQRLEAGRYAYQAGYDLAQQAAAALESLQGVFCAADTLAMGVLDAWRERQSTAPLRIIGCDDIPLAAWHSYQLTTVAQPVEAIAQRVLAILEQIWRGETVTPMMTALPPQLKVRSSG